MSTPGMLDTGSGKSPFFTKGRCGACDEEITVTKSGGSPVAHACKEPVKVPQIAPIPPTGSIQSVERKQSIDSTGAPIESQRAAMVKVYIVGSHSVGKTHLARWIAKTYGLKLVTEVARSVLAEREIPLEALRSDIERTAEFQVEVFRRQAIAEDAAGSSFVSDRAFDNLAYAASHTISLSRIAAGAEKYIERLRQPGVVVFFVRPHRELCAQDGTREREDWEEIIRIDGMIRFMLELHDIDHVVVASLSMAERARTIRAVLSAHGLRPSSP